ncbi:MAG: VRR-NUC domain-containing protein [Comamonas sp.]|nr:VRR-NUC domain-containing protein [Comamonas sp.]
MSAPAAVAPHRFYYLHNFQHALQWLAQRCADLLDAPEHTFLQQFAQLPQPSQALLVRMLMRRGPWFRHSKLQYAEIGDTLQAAQPLQALGWMDEQAPMPIEVLFDLHTRAELHTILPAHLPPSTQRKQDWLQLLIDAELPAQPYTQWHPHTTENVWLLSDAIRQLGLRLRLMFFGNLHQEWSEFVLADLGIFRYETVLLPIEARAFQCRTDVDTYLAMQAGREALHSETVDAASVLDMLARCRSPNPWLERRRAKLLMQLGQWCERAQNLSLAQSIYADCTYPGARHRHVRVLELQSDYAAALALAQTALQAPESEEELQKLQRMLPRLLRHTGAPALRRRAQVAVVEAALMDIALPLPATPSSVEYVLRDHWHRGDAPVFYVENTLITALFGLLCWPAIFAPLQGAFFHPFQSAPTDFAAPDFAQRRAAVFAQCLAQLDDGSYRSTILARWADKYGLQNPLVIWPALNEALLEMALLCIPAAHLRAMFARLQADPKNHRTGLPDLIRFWPAEQRYAMVEVKAPGDKLQDNQIRWLQYFAQHGIPAHVCHVTWQPPEQALCA